METLKWTIASFSPTKTTQKTADAIAEGSGCPVSRLDLTDPKLEGQTIELESSSVLLAAMPVYGGRIPALARKRLQAVKGHGQYAVAVVVYGNRAYEDALLELKNVLEEGGFKVIAAGAFIGEHSIVRSIAKGRPDDSDIQKAHRFGADIMEKIRSGEELSSVSVPGNFPYKETKDSAIHPSADETCVKCRTCAYACPAGAIPVDTPNLTDSDKCINCMRCIAVCPQKSRSMPAPYLAKVAQMLEKVASGYAEPEYFLK